MDQSKGYAGEGGGDRTITALGNALMLSFPQAQRDFATSTLEYTESSQVSVSLSARQGGQLMLCCKASGTADNLRPGVASVRGVVGQV